MVILIEIYFKVVVLESFFIEYRDPIFGLIIFFLIIILISISTYWLGLFKKRDKENSINLFLQNFSIKDREDFLTLLENTNDMKLLLTLAKCFYQSGEYNKAISIYLKILKSVKNQKDKIEILYELASIHLKIGFLKRSKEFFLNILKITPRNLEALKKLLIIYEKLQDFEKANELLEPFEELTLNLNEKEKLYLKREEAFIGANMILHSNLKNEEKCSKLFEIHSKKYKIDRLLIEFLIEHNIRKFYANLGKIDLLAGLDLLWYLDESKVNLDIIRGDKLLSEIFSAKGYQLTDKSDIFELSILIDLNSYKERKSSASLNFKYMCKSCNEIYPIHFSRCPNCLSLFEFEVIPNLIELK